MNIYVESVTGRLFRVDVDNEPGMTVWDLKSKIFEAEGIMPVDQHLIYRDVVLANHQKLQADCGIESGSRIRMVLQARAGPISSPGRNDISVGKPSLDNHVATNNAAFSQLMEILQRSGSSGPPSSHASTDVLSSNGHHESRFTTRRLSSDKQLDKKYAFLFGGTSSSTEPESPAMTTTTFTEVDRLAAQQRAQDNIRTMAKMRELQSSMMKLCMEKGKQNYSVVSQLDSADANGSSIAAPLNMPSETARSRRLCGGGGPSGRGTGGNYGGRSRVNGSAPSTVMSFSCGLTYCGCSAPEDTSAKESSAGETEHELEEHSCSDTRHGVSTLKQQQRHCSQRKVTASSSSDLESSCAALTTSDPDLLYTADDDCNTRRGGPCDFRPGRHVKSVAAHSSTVNLDFLRHGNNDDEAILETRSLPGDLHVLVLQDDDERAQSDDDSDGEAYESAPSQFEEGGVNIIDNDNANEITYARQDELPSYSDPSELSSGMIICELLSSRRPRIRRKIRGDPGPFRRPPPVCPLVLYRDHPQMIDKRALPANFPQYGQYIVSPKLRSRQVNRGPPQTITRCPGTHLRNSVTPSTKFTYLSASGCRDGHQFEDGTSNQDYSNGQNGATTSPVVIGSCDPRQSIEGINGFHCGSRRVVRAHQAIQVVTSRSGSEDGPLDDTAEEAGSGIDEYSYGIRPPADTGHLRTLRGDSSISLPHTASYLMASQSGVRHQYTCSGQQHHHAHGNMMVKRPAGAHRIAKPTFKTRPRSKPRGVKKTFSTGESSSDEQGLNSSGLFGGSFAMALPCQASTSSHDPSLRTVRGVVHRRGMPHCHEGGGGRCKTNFHPTSSSLQQGRLPPMRRKHAADHRATVSRSSINSGSTLVVTTAASMANPGGVCSSSGGSGGGTVSRSHRPPQSSQSQQRCNTCGCKLSISGTFQCRCGKTLCARHRVGEAHSCSYDYKCEARKAFKEAAKVLVDKLPKV